MRMSDHGDIQKSVISNSRASENYNEIYIGNDTEIDTVVYTVVYTEKTLSCTQLSENLCELHSQRHFQCNIFLTCI